MVPISILIMPLIYQNGDFTEIRIFRIPGAMTPAGLLIIAVCWHAVSADTDRRRVTNPTYYNVGGVLSSNESVAFFKDTISVKNNDPISLILHLSYLTIKVNDRSPRTQRQLIAARLIITSASGRVT